MEITDIQSYVVMGIIILSILIVIFAFIWQVVIDNDEEVDLDGVYSDDEVDIIDMISDDDENDPDSPN